MQTELITGGVAQLVRDGVATGKYKTLHREKVVGSACVALPEEELRLIDGNPAFELYDFGYTDDVRMLVRHPNLVAVNNALMVDLTGQVAAESIGSRIWTGVGGQTAFMIAAQYSPGGRSVTVLPSSHLMRGREADKNRQRAARRVAGDGAADARGLRGNGERGGDAAGEDGARADRGADRGGSPGLPGELRAEAKRLYGIGM